MTQDTMERRDLKMSFCRSSDKGALTNMKWILVTCHASAFLVLCEDCPLFAGSNILLPDLTEFGRCSFVSTKTAPACVWI